MTNRTATDPRKEWGDALRLERLRRRLSQDDVAHEAGVRSGTISKLEHGRGGLGVFLAVADVLDVRLLERQP